MSNNINIPTKPLITGVSNDLRAVVDFYQTIDCSGMSQVQYQVHLVMSKYVLDLAQWYDSQDEVVKQHSAAQFHEYNERLKKQQKRMVRLSFLIWLCVVLLSFFASFCINYYHNS
ncbi:MAG: hypothetical protein ACSHX0_06765 [Akkermansiaceae bacterium]